MRQNKANTPNYLKFLNKKKILRYIFEHEKLSRSDLANALYISKPTVSLIVDELIKENWIYEKESFEASTFGGRKPIHLYGNPNARFIVGIDIGGTTIEVGVLNVQGELIGVQFLNTQILLKEDFLKEIVKSVSLLLEKHQIPKDKIMAVGVGVPGITDTEKGIVIEAPSLGWINYPVRDELKKLLDYPIYVDNDVNVAVLGEQWKGTAHEAKHVILITLGTGVGCGIIVNGELYRGDNYAAGEIGYLITDKNEAKRGYADPFAGYGFLDSHVGGYSIVNKMKEHLKNEHITHSLNKEELTAKEVFEYAKKGDALAMEVIQEAIEHLSYALVNVISIFNPQCVILSGGLSKSGDWFLPTVQVILDKHLPLKTKVMITELEHLALIGTGALCLKEHESLLKNERVM